MSPEARKAKKICIVGSGLVGTLLVILLTDAGFEVDVYEKRKDPRADCTTRGRSIALTLSDRGWKALRAAGLEDVIRAKTSPAYGRIVHPKDGEVYAQDYGDGKQATYTVNRNQLNVMLLEKALASGKATFYFEQGCESINEKTGEVIFTDRATADKAIKRYDHIIAMDGAFSAVRKTFSEEKFWTFESILLDFGYKELHIPPTAENKPALEDHRVHVWPRKNAVLIAFPTPENHFALNLFLPRVGKNSIESIDSPEALKAFFKKEFSDVLPFMPNLKDDFFNNPPSTLTQIKGGPWNIEGKVLLMGDAAHATTPFYGMGMNIGFEDCTVFMTLLEQHNYDFDAAFRLLGDARKPDTDAMTDLSYENFQSLSESPDHGYQTKWLLERRLWKLFPEKWTPVYVLIAFSDGHLRDVPGIKRRQDLILHDLIEANPKILELSDKELKKVVQTIPYFALPEASKIVPKRSKTLIKHRL